MNVYQLKPKGNYCGGMALVAAPTYEKAVAEYYANGIHGEYFEFGEYEFQSSCDIPILGLEWQGDTSVVCDHMYFE